MIHWTSVLIIAFMSGIGGFMVGAIIIYGDRLKEANPDGKS